MRVLLGNGPRTCRACGEEKPLDAFERDASAPFGRSRRCKACAGARFKQLATQPEIPLRLAFPVGAHVMLRAGYFVRPGIPRTGQVAGYGRNDRSLRVHRDGTQLTSAHAWHRRLWVIDWEAEIDAPGEREPAA